MKQTQQGQHQQHQQQQTAVSIGAIAEQEKLDLEAVRVLLSANANVMLKDENGQRAIHIEAEK